MKKLIIIFGCLGMVLQVAAQAKPWNPSLDLFWEAENNASSSNHFVFMNDNYGLGWWKKGKSALVFTPLVNFDNAVFNTLNYSAFVGGQLEYVGGKKLYVRLGALGGENESDIWNENYPYATISNTPFYMGYGRNYDINGVISYSPNQVFNLQAGIGKFNLGNGQRSLLLSDVGRNYPYAALNTKVWKIKLLNLYQFFQETEQHTRLNKFAATHYLSVDLTPNLELSLFETVVFQPSDTTWNRGFELEYLNPLLFFRPAEYGLGSSDNVLLGMNVNYKIGHHLVFGQVILDDGAVSEILNRTRWWANKYGFQIGVKGNLLQYKFHYSTEVNAVRPFTYSHLNTSQNYGHRGFVLAHPAGSNFIESYTRLQYEYNEKLKMNFTFMHMLRGGENDTESLSSGTNPYQPYTDIEFEYGYTIANGGALRRTRLTLGAEYELVERLHLLVFANAIVMNDRVNQVNSTSFGLQFGVKTNLWKSNSYSF